MKQSHSSCYQGNTNTIVSSTATQVAPTNTIISSGFAINTIPTAVSSGSGMSTICMSVGINEQSSNNTISIYPNPAGNQFTVYGLEFMHHTTLEIYNVLGQRLRSFPFGEGWGGAFDVSSLPSGIYFVRVADEKESWVGKFVKE